MRIKIVMNSGEVHKLEMHPEDFISKTKNQMGVTLNGLVKVNDETWLNPSNVSSVEVISEPSVKVLK